MVLLILPAVFLHGCYTVLEVEEKKMERRNVGSGKEGFFTSSHLFVPDEDSCCTQWHLGWEEGVGMRLPCLLVTMEASQGCCRQAFDGSKS